MMKENNINLVLVADDDPDDRMLLSEAFEETNFNCTLQFVEDGVELMNYLLKKGNYTHVAELPDLILLDINMPKKDGKQALQEIKENPAIKHIPVLIFSTSGAKDEIKLTYSLGANSFIIKPPSYTGFIEIVKNIQSYWANTVSLKM